MIHIKDLKKSFNGRLVVDIPDFHLSGKEIIGLVGNNGAGKTTLIRLMLDLLKPEQGVVLSKQKPVYQSDHWKYYTGAYLDTDFLIDFLTPEEYFRFIARMIGLPEQEIALRLGRYELFMAGEVLDQNKFIRELSAGNKQKVGIIGAILLHPEILILDEPFTYLDPSSQICLRNLLIDYHLFFNAAIFISSHNMKYISELCHKIALMEHGRIIRIINNQGQSSAELNSYFSKQNL